MNIALLCIAIVLWEGVSLPKQAAPLAAAQAQMGKIALEMGYELVDIELVKEPTGRFLRVYADKEGGITLDDLEKLHRKLLPVADRIDYDYMEVSSPGADRPLKKPQDFARHEGDEVELHLYKPYGGAKQLRGTLVGLVGDDIVIETAQGNLSFDKNQVSLVKPVIELSEEELKELLPDDGASEEKGGEDCGIQ